MNSSGNLAIVSTRVTWPLATSELRTCWTVRWHLAVCERQMKSIIFHIASERGARAHRTRYPSTIAHVVGKYAVDIACSFTAGYGSALAGRSLKRSCGTKEVFISSLRIPSTGSADGHYSLYIYIYVCILHCVIHVTKISDITRL